MALTRKAQAPVSRKLTPGVRKKKRTVPQAALNSEQQALLDIAERKRYIEQVQAEVRVMEEQLIARMDEQGIEHVIVRNGKQTVKGTLVAGSTIHTDETALKKRVGAQVWKQITSLVLDRTKLDDAVKNGEVDLADVAAVSTETPRKRYVRVTTK